MTKLAAKRAETRRKLLESTLTVISEAGLGGVSVDGVAKSVGVTKGAVYDNFASKDAMIVEALALLPAEATSLIKWPTSRSGTVEDRLRTLAMAILEGKGKLEREALLSAEFAVYAIQHPELRSRLLEVTSMGPAQVQERLQVLFEPNDLTITIEAFAHLLQALIPGMAQLRAVSPRPPSVETVVSIFKSFAGNK